MQHQQLNKPSFDAYRSLFFFTSDSWSFNDSVFMKLLKLNLRTKKTNGKYFIIYSSFNKNFTKASIIVIQLQLTIAKNKIFH